MDAVAIINGIADKLNVPVQTLIEWYTKSVIVDSLITLLVWLIICVCVFLLGDWISKIEEPNVEKYDLNSNWCAGRVIQIIAGIVLLIAIGCNVPKILVPQKSAFNEIMTDIRGATK